MSLDFFIYLCYGIMKSLSYDVLLGSV